MERLTHYYHRPEKEPLDMNRGFSTFLSTLKSMSQEIRRQNDIPSNFPGHSRSSTTDDSRQDEFLQELDLTVSCTLAEFSPQQTPLPIHFCDSPPTFFPVPGAKLKGVLETSSRLRKKERKSRLSITPS